MHLPAAPKGLLLHNDTHSSWHPGGTEQKHHADNAQPLDFMALPSKTRLKVYHRIPGIGRLFQSSVDCGKKLVSWPKILLKMGIRYRRAATEKFFENKGRDWPGTPNIQDSLLLGFLTNSIWTVFCAGNSPGR